MKTKPLNHDMKLMELEPKWKHRSILIGLILLCNAIIAANSFAIWIIAEMPSKNFGL